MLWRCLLLRIGRILGELRPLGLRNRGELIEVVRIGGKIGTLECGNCIFKWKLGLISCFSEVPRTCIRRDFIGFWTDRDLKWLRTTGLSCWVKNARQRASRALWTLSRLHEGRVSGRALSWWKESQPVESETSALGGFGRRRICRLSRSITVLAIV